MVEDGRALRMLRKYHSDILRMECGSGGEDGRVEGGKLIIGGGAGAEDGCI